MLICFEKPSLKTVNLDYHNFMSYSFNLCCASCFYSSIDEDGSYMKKDEDNT